tara:strand:+ start:3813 stop:4142 length:330 start_codon:yes stop_codon:yes gene_type:complete
VSYNLGNSNIRKVLEDSLNREELQANADVTGGTAGGSPQKNTDDKISGRRMAGFVWDGKGVYGDFAKMVQDPANAGQVDAWMNAFVNGGLNDDIFGPPPPPPLPPEASA